MSGAVLNSRFLRKLLTSGKEDIERVSMLKEYISSTACELTMLILSISVTFNVTCLTVTSLITKSCQHSNVVDQYILVHFTLADLRYGGRFVVHVVIVNLCLQK